MATSRRKFILTSIKAGALLACSTDAIQVFAKSNNSSKSIAIMHTNDVHSRLEPFPMDGGKYQGMGGVKARYQALQLLRKQHPDMLLLDAGDMFQGTPYFNFYKGKPEIEAMNLLGYHAATLGNHDFDNGVEGLAQQLKLATFDIVNCNYDVSQTALAQFVKPYAIYRKAALKIGVLGVGIELKGLVPDALCAGVRYQDPIERANSIAKYLKKKQKCDYVICLSHLGFEYNDDRVSDKILASQSANIDLILGGHTHTFLEAPVTIKNLNNKEVFVNQVGWGGLQLGVLKIFFNENNHNHSVSSNTVISLKETSI